MNETSVHCQPYFDGLPCDGRGDCVQVKLGEYSCSCYHFWLDITNCTADVWEYWDGKAAWFPLIALPLLPLIALFFLEVACDIKKKVFNESFFAKVSAIVFMLGRVIGFVIFLYVDVTRDSQKDVILTTEAAFLVGSDAAMFSLSFIAIVWCKVNYQVWHLRNEKIRFFTYLKRFAMGLTLFYIVAFLVLLILRGAYLSATVFYTSNDVLNALTMFTLSVFYIAFSARYAKEAVLGSDIEGGSFASYKALAKKGRFMFGLGIFLVLFQLFNLLFLREYSNSQTFSRTSSFLLVVVVAVYSVVVFVGFCSC
eukprot:TRINITY_DN4775_c0_g1_i1.p1 TRINITY_DN4775_c0_g1~~TRINITY_DN4775_c0_g1_i1.p1  ORF type:complete len:310 (-),score=13.03 TRINITY_DN4775_c0_g1_i1:54-983(-)